MLGLAEYLGVAEYVGCVRVCSAWPRYVGRGRVCWAVPSILGAAEYVGHGRVLLGVAEYVGRGRVCCAWPSMLGVAEYVERGRACWASLNFYSPNPARGQPDVTRPKLPTYGRMTFSNAGPSAWNSQPNYRKDSSLTLVVFKRS